MSFGTLGVSKQKGGSVGSSGHHNDRTRETPNADPERGHLNRVLIGNDRNVREAVSEVIAEHGGKFRADSVEAIEFLLSASHEFFLDDRGEIDPKKVERFCGQAVRFLNDRRNGGICVKAVLHLDERTPHIHAHTVPIDPKGRLNCKHYLDGRAKLRELHDRYAEYMAPLGLERGREGSRARHQTIKSFYASIERETELKVEFGRVPDPPRVFLSAEGRKNYKEEVLKAVLEQLKEPIQTLRHQAMLTQDERAHRVEAERRADERVATVEQAARAQLAKVERMATERFENLRQQALQIYEENKELRTDNNALRVQRNELNELLGQERWRAQESGKLARERGERLSDIPMPEVMERMGYDGERHGEAHVYRGEGNVVAMRIEQQKAFDSQGRLICRNSLDLVVHMRRNNEGDEQFNHTDGLRWLADNFGEGRAAASYVANREHAALSMLDRMRSERSFGEPEHSPDRMERGGGGFER